MSGGITPPSRLLKEVPEPRTECAVVGRTANLEQKIGASSRPSHLLRLVHASIDEEVRGPFGHRGSDTQAGAMIARPGRGQLE